ncbi:MAG: PA14 domain-containing protein, partial [Roseicyclus sp.]|nr:PA14 domain-containing protein [Roseicyclus sp.]
GLEADGFVFLEAGTHRFDVRSDDGFRLSLGGEVVVEFEGLRGASTSTAWFEAEETGYYALDLLYFENGGAQVLDVDLDGRDLDASVLFSALDPAADSFLF